MGKKIFQPTSWGGMKLMVMSICPILRNFLPFAFIPADVDKWFRGLIQELKEERRSSATPREDIFQVLLNCVDKYGEGIFFLIFLTFYHLIFVLGTFLYCVIFVIFFFRFCLMEQKLTKLNWLAMRWPYSLKVTKHRAVCLDLLFMKWPEIPTFKSAFTRKSPMFWPNITMNSRLKLCKRWNIWII